jgi:hypothetical protein
MSRLIRLFAQNYAKNTITSFMHSVLYASNKETRFRFLLSLWYLHGWRTSLSSKWLYSLHDPSGIGNKVSRKLLRDSLSGSSVWKSLVLMQVVMSYLWFIKPFWTQLYKRIKSSGGNIIMDRNNIKKLFIKDSQWFYVDSKGAKIKSTTAI